MSFKTNGETERRMEKFDTIRGGTPNFQFWDVVIVTAADEQQKSAFDKQILLKLSNNELPNSPSYFVICDPPGYKIGNGGATMVVLEELHAKFGDSVYEKKCIIIHAGGYSQRLPTASVLGKVFTAFPTREPILQMLEMKLASYIDFPAKIKGGGIFVCCSDTIEVYNDMEKSWKFHPNGMTGLGHPSSIEIGTTHGVYMLNDMNDNSITTKCKRFLHKPSAKLMRDMQGCVQLTAHREEVVITDSAYFMAPDVCKKLLSFYQKNKPLTCEIDAYGDFLQALGTDSDHSYITNTANVVNQTSSLVQMRRKVYELLRGTDLHVVALVPRAGVNRDVSSHFYHFGTTQEYLHAMTAEEVLPCITGCETVSFCAGLPYKYTTRSGSDSDPMANPPRLMSSLILSCVSVGEGTILEYCRVREFSKIGPDCIVSSCSLKPNSCVPSGTILHTAAINCPDSGKLQFITIAFGKDDNMKASASRVDAPAKIKYFGAPLQECFSDVDLIFPGYGEDSNVTLWHAKLFSAFSTMEESCSCACKRLNLLMEGRESGKKCQLQRKGRSLYSMADLLRLKNVDEMLNFRSNLRKEIEATRHQSALSTLYTK